MDLKLTGIGKFRVNLKKKEMTMERKGVRKEIKKKIMYREIEREAVKNNVILFRWSRI